MASMPAAEIKAFVVHIFSISVFVEMVLKKELCLEYLPPARNSSQLVFSCSIKNVLSEQQIAVNLILFVEDQT